MRDTKVANQVLDRICANQSRAARAEARLFLDLHDLAVRIGRQQAEAELAPALTRTRGSVGHLMDQADNALSVPAMFDLLLRGRVDVPRVLVVAHELMGVLSPDDPRWATVDALAAERAPRLTRTKLKNYVHKLLITIDPAAAQRDHEKALKQRRVIKYVGPTGMSTILADLSGHDAALVMATLHAVADQAPKDDPRTRPQLLADAFAGLFRAVAEGRPLDLIPAPTPNAEPVEPDYARIPEQWVEPDHENDRHENQASENSCHESEAGEGDCQEIEAGAASAGDSPLLAGTRGETDDDAHDRAMPDAQEQIANGSHEPSAGPVPVEPPVVESPSHLPQCVPDVWTPPKLGTQQGAHLRLVVHIDADTLARHGDVPGFLAAHGYITPQAARDLAKQCGSADLLIRPPRPEERREPGCGGDHEPRHEAEHVHHPHHDEYRPRADLARHVTARHQHCRMPGCPLPAERCDHDHVTEWPAGPTCSCNLAPLCRGDHNLKTWGGWSYVLHPDGWITWTTALGRVYQEPPPDDLRPDER